MKGKAEHTKMLGKEGK